MAIFRLLHTSDLHVALRQERIGIVDYRQAGLLFPHGLRRVRLTSSYSPDLLDGLIERVYRQGDRFDAVLISGDLATTGKEKDLEQARSCIDGDASARWYSSHSFGKPRPEIGSHRALKGAGRPILLLPGNHDRYRSSFLSTLLLRPFPPGGTLFDEYFGHYWKVGQGVQGWISPPKGDARLGLVSADLSLRENEGKDSLTYSYLGQGKAYEDVIAELGKLTDELRADYPNLGLLWIVHFPPKYPQNKDFLRLLEDETLIKAAYKKGISYVLSGHTHIPRAYTATSSDGSTVEVLCAGTAAQVVALEGNFIHELTIEVGGKGITSISFQSFQWYEAVQQWVQVACP